MLLQEVAPVVLAIGASGRYAEETPDRGRKILGSGRVTLRELGKELGYQPRNARVVATRIPACALNDGGIDGDVQAFLGHGDSNTHEYTKRIRISKRSRNSA
jgi:hypothetical protein